MDKKGDVKLIPKEMWGLIRAFVLILIIVVVSTKVFFFVNPAYAASKSTLERFSEAINILEKGDSRSVTLDIEKSVWLFGFNKDYNYIKYRRTDYLIRRHPSITLSKPRHCPTGSACLCLCETDCKKVINCKVFEDIKFFVVTDISDQLNGGIKYEYDGEEGNYLAMPGKGIKQVEIWREGDVIYIGEHRPESGQAREEFERLVNFANRNIGVMYRGTCKLIFDIDTQKLTHEYFIMVYTNRTAKLFSGESEQRRNIATKTIAAAPILSVDFYSELVDEVFKQYNDLPREDFIIDPHITILPEGVEEGILYDRVVLLQRNGRWLWTKFSNFFYEDDAPDDCE